MFSPKLAGSFRKRGLRLEGDKGVVEENLNLSSAFPNVEGVLRKAVDCSSLPSEPAEECDCFRRFAGGGVTSAIVSFFLTFVEDCAKRMKRFQARCRHVGVQCPSAFGEERTE